MGTYAGIDLHSSNNYIGIMDQDYKRLSGRRQPNDLTKVLKVLEPFKAELEGVIVESTYNWYWLVDGLQENGYKVHLANPRIISFRGAFSYLHLGAPGYEAATCCQRLK
jgi:transposase